MKTLIIYLSATGNTERLAREIAGQIGDAQLLPIQLKTSIPKSRSWLIFKFGFLMTFRWAFRFKVDKVDVSSFDQVIIGTPVWMAKAAPPLFTVVNRLGAKNKIQGAFVSCGAAASGVFEDMEQNLPSLKLTNRLTVSEHESYEDPEVKARILNFVDALNPRAKQHSEMTISEG